MSHNNDPFDRAVVVWGSHFQFSPGERLRFPAVRSRYMVWSLRGSGQVIANGQKIELSTGGFALLPWQHAVSYRASERDPFYVGGLHIIPAHDRRHRIEFIAAHRPDSPLWYASYRRDVPLAGASQIVAGDLAQHAALGHVASYAVECFLRGGFDEAAMRTLGGLALREFERTAREVGARREIPENLQRLVDWVKEHLDQPIGLDELAEKSGASRSTVQRLIRKHFNESALEWITGLKLSRAKWLLMSTTLLVSDVAQQVGFSDPYYFSRLFRAKEGQSPRACRSSGQFAAKRPK